MSLSIFEHGDGRFRLVRDDREIGWVEGRTICFRGYADTAATADAATTAYGAVIQWTAGQLRTGPVPNRRRRLSARPDGMPDGMAEWLTLGGTRVARLRRFGPDGLSDAEPEVGFEIDLPAGIVGGIALGVAQALDGALQAHAAGADAPPTARRATIRPGRSPDRDEVGRSRIGPAVDRTVARAVERSADRRPDRTRPAAPASPPNAARRTDPTPPY